MASSTRHQVVGALSWSALQEFSQRGLQLVIGILLARVLMPAQFGLIAMLTVFIAVSQVLLDSGFGSALIQKKQPTELDKCSVFYLNLLVSILLTAVLWVAAPWIAQFYRQPQLTSLTRALSFLIIINGFVVVQSALVVRELNFKRQTLVGLIGAVLAGGLGIGMAMRGFGVWSLVAQQLANNFIRTCLYWSMSDWRPKWMFSFKALKAMFRFGSQMAASSVMNTIFENIYPLVIGKLFSAASLGYYTRARTLETIPAQSLGSIIARVTFPVFSHLQDEPERLRKALQKAIKLCTFLQFPAMLGLAAVAEPLVLVLLTEKWAPSIPYLQQLCLVGLWYPLHRLNLNGLLAVGRSDIFFRMEVLKKALTILNIAITYRWGVMAMIYGQSVNAVLSYFINTYYSKQYLGYSTWQQLRDLAPYLAAAGFMGLVVAMVEVPGVGYGVQLTIKVVLGAAVYLGLAVLFRFPALHELIQLVRDRGANKSSRARPEKAAPGVAPVA